jgi:putative endonuclease
MTAWSVYIVECADNSLYCGVTTDLDVRLQKHNQGTASRYTRSRRPVVLAAVRDNLDKSAAFKLEHRIKQLPAGQKIAALKKSES